MNLVDEEELLQRNKDSRTVASSPLFHYLIAIKTSSGVAALNQKQRCTEELRTEEQLPWEPPQLCLNFWTAS
jgi:hypothetical protein